MYSRETLIRIVLIALLLYSALSLYSAKRELNELRGAALEEEEELRELLSENEELQSELRQGMTDEDIARLARERLGLVLPGERLFVFSYADEDP